MTKTRRAAVERIVAEFEDERRTPQTTTFNREERAVIQAAARQREVTVSEFIRVAAVRDAHRELRSPEAA